MEAYSEVYAPEQIDEAEGSYGQTPKARQAMGKLAIARREKPASEYSQKGEKTKKVKEIEKHTRRIDNGPDVGNRGKKSTKPRHSGFLGKSGRGKMDQERRDYARDSAVEYTAGGHKPGPGTVTKNPKKLRKQKAMGEIDEQFDIFDVVLEFLQVEGYAETLEEAEWIMANELDAEDIEAILEAEGSYGETPKAYSAALKTKMTAKRKPFLKAMQRRTNPANRKDAYASPRKGMTASDREEARAGAAYGSPRGHDYPSQGPGSVTKNPKKLRKQKAIGEID